ncbi:cobalamin biosynthesis protein CbiM [Romboutsia maritimum]|uniref:Cobalamin biosynthesis protein CbiM n=1 Tax=Romboutsia maritimum TaxID=2020948 RepID=A0A371IQQ8_9FIRM|nr:energy-coupling factor ABC transporter permease [Romboutsia maritimum]RDY22798.1 cobalamin biosynthesis protein CbiM [Romboutsia maritimum]
MHMADALISPVVGGTLWAATAGMTAYCATKISKEKNDSLDSYKIENYEKKIPLMGVMGAFVFASQMINFTIPGTGSSGHIGGGILLASLLGPEAGFLTIASVLLIQCLFFADGGLLAYGCNVINMGFFACFIAYPLIYKKIMKGNYTTSKIFISSILSVVIGLQLGAFGVVMETLVSGISELPFSTFVALMQPIHLAIGLVEGILTGCVLSFVYNARPELLDNKQKEGGKMTFKGIVTTLAVITLIIGGGLSLVASSNPDGLEWAIFNVTGKEELKSDSKTSEVLSGIQETTAFLPDYSFKDSEGEVGTTVSGIVGSAITLGVCALVGIGLHKSKQKSHKAN